MEEEEVHTQVASCETDGSGLSAEEDTSKSKVEVEVEVIFSPQVQEVDDAKDLASTTPTPTIDSKQDHHNKVEAKNEHENESEAQGDGGEADDAQSLLIAPMSKSEEKDDEDEDGGEKEDEVSVEVSSKEAGEEEEATNEQKENEGGNDTVETPACGEAEVDDRDEGKDDEPAEAPTTKEGEGKAEEGTAQEEHRPPSGDNPEPVTQGHAPTGAAAVDRDGDTAGAVGEERDEEGEGNQEEGAKEEGERSEETKGLHSRSKSKEELVESLLQVMEDIVVARAAAASANAPGITHSRRRSHHHPLPNAPLPPLPNGDDAAAFLSPRSSQADAAVDSSGASDNHGSKEKHDETVPSSLSSSSSTTSEAMAEDESEDGVLSPREGVVSPREGSESTSRRAGLMGTRRRPRGPLPPTPGKDSSGDSGSGRTSPLLASADSSGSSSADADSHLPRYTPAFNTVVVPCIG
jgi:hypothetical protein